MDQQPGTYEEWRVTGKVRGEDYDFTWSKMRNPHLVDPEQGARKFVTQLDVEWDDGPHLHRRTITIREWRTMPTGPLRPNGGRPPMPDMDTTCTRCEQPRREHGGPKRMGACPGQSGIRAKRFSIVPI